MSAPRSVHLTPGEAEQLLSRELCAARHCVLSSQMDAAQDKFVSALGLALQLGPAPVERVLQHVMHTVREDLLRSDSETLSTFGPSLVHVVGQVRESGALPSTRVMEAWATVASDVGTIIGQVGVALTIESDRRLGMMANARIRAAALDEVTDTRFAMADWIDQISGHS